MTDTPKRYQGWWIFATAIAVVIFQNAPAVLRQPDAAFVQSVWVMTQSGNPLEKWIAQIAADRGMASAWFANFALTFCLQLALALIAAAFLWFMCRKAARVKLWRMSWIACTVIVLLSGGAFAWQLPSLLESRKMEARTLLPLDLAEWAGQREGLLFANPSALPLLQPLTPKTPWLPLEEAAAVVREPVKWRQLDQQKAFGAVVLNGRPSEYASLLQHLIDSPEWSLAYADNFGIGFVRGRQLWQPPAPEQLAKKFRNPRSAAGYLSQAALALSLVNQNGDAVRYFDLAEKLAPDEPEIFARKAVFLNGRKRFGDAVAAADQALALNPGLLPALQIKALSLLEARQTDAAWKAALRLPELAPEDIYSLSIYARCANAARAFSSETDALEKIISLGEKQGVPVTNYRIFLAQSYARRGFSKQALAEFRKAAADPYNSARQKKDITDSIANIEAQIGSAPNP